MLYIIDVNDYFMSGDRTTIASQTAYVLPHPGGRNQFEQFVQFQLCNKFVKHDRSSRVFQVISGDGVGLLFSGGLSELTF